MAGQNGCAHEEQHRVFAERRGTAGTSARFSDDKYKSSRSRALREHSRAWQRNGSPICARLGLPANTERAHIQRISKQETKLLFERSKIFLLPKLVEQLVLSPENKVSCSAAACQVRLP